MDSPHLGPLLITHLSCCSLWTISICGLFSLLTSPIAHHSPHLGPLFINHLSCCSSWTLPVCGLFSLLTSPIAHYTLPICGLFSLLTSPVAHHGLSPFGASFSHTWWHIFARLGSCSCCCSSRPYCCPLTIHRLLLSSKRFLKTCTTCHNQLPSTASSFFLMIIYFYYYFFRSIPIKDKLKGTLNYFSTPLVGNMLHPIIKIYCHCPYVHINWITLFSKFLSKHYVIWCFT